MPEGGDENTFAFLVEIIVMPVVISAGTRPKEQVNLHHLEHLC